MSVIIKREETAAAVASIEGVFKSFLYPNMKPAQVGAVRAHMDWIKTQLQTFVSVKLETVPQLQLTRVTLEFTHHATPPSKLNGH